MAPPSPPDPDLAAYADALGRSLSQRAAERILLGLDALGIDLVSLSDEEITALCVQAGKDITAEWLTSQEQTV